MITQLSAVKARLGIDEFEVKYDALLTNAIRGVGTRFGRICCRNFGRTVDAKQEFDARDAEISLVSYPVELVSKFELKESETGGWEEQTDVKYVVRQGCVISLQKKLGPYGAGRVTYTGGYVLPGTTVGAGQTSLPDDLEQAAVEQIAAWFTSRDKIGLIRNWPKGGVYQEFQQTELLISVMEVLRAYERIKVF